MSASLTPTTVMLWLSWPTDEAMAPRLRPKPVTKARPMFLFFPWRATTATLARSAAGSARRRLPSARTAIGTLPVMILPAVTPITGMVAEGPGVTKSSAVTGVAFIESRPTGAILLRV